MVTRRDVDAVALTRSALPQTYYLKMRTPWRRLAVRAKPEILQKRPHRLLVNALRKEHVADPSLVFAETDFFLNKANQHTELDTFLNYPHIGDRRLTETSIRDVARTGEVFVGNGGFVNISSGVTLRNALTNEWV